MSLDKKFCKICIKDWEKIDYKRWDDGWVNCPLTFDFTSKEDFETDKNNCIYNNSGISISSNPPCNCPFHLEHLLTE